MLRKAFFAIALVASLSSSALAETNVIGGDHVMDQNTTLTFPIYATSDSGEVLQGMDMFLAIDELGPMFTSVDLQTNTIWSGKNTGTTTWPGAVHQAPGYTPIYGITTNAGTEVEPGIVAWVTVDSTGVAPGIYTLSLSQPENGDTSVYVGFTSGLYTNGSIEVVPEPGSVILGLFAAAGLGAVVIRRRRARNA